MRARRLGGLCLAMLLSAVLVVGCGGGGGGSFTLPSNATLPTGGGGGGGGGGQTTTETVSPPQTQKTSANNQGESTNWALIALIAGAVVLVALIGWLIARSRGARGRYSRAVNDIYAEGVTVHDRLATLGPQPGAAIAGVDPMLDKLTADARRLQPSAPERPGAGGAGGPAARPGRDPLGGERDRDDRRGGRDGRSAGSAGLDAGLARPGAGDALTEGAVR